MPVPAKTYSKLSFLFPAECFVFSGILPVFYLSIILLLVNASLVHLQTLSQLCKSLNMFKHTSCSINSTFAQNNLLSLLTCSSLLFSLPSALGTQLLFLEFLFPSFWGFPFSLPCIESLVSWIFCFPKVSEKGWVGNNFLNLKI